ncbi:5959_t:CDS:1, partial [Gigaspora margarita]
WLQLSLHSSSGVDFVSGGYLYCAYCFLLVSLVLISFSLELASDL